MENNPLVNEPTILDEVIAAIKIRSSKAQKNIYLALIAMIAIVIVGGGASIGSFASSEAAKVKELEVERKELVGFNKSLEVLLENPTTDKRIKETYEYVTKNYGKSKNYTLLLSKIEKQNSISWRDIAIRVTVAVLTLFLVQIFFHIYKYNQKQASQLSAKAEVLSLFTDKDADLNELRKALLSNYDASPKFEGQVETPTDQVLKIFNSIKNS